MTKRAITDTLRLPSSHAMPQLGFGVYQSPAEQCVQSCLAALRRGYRHVDTAQYYGNEASVGRAARESGLPRRDLFLTTKILDAAGSVDASHARCLESVRRLDAAPDGYADLFLVHSPGGGPRARREMWQALERLHAEGRARSIGVSNFGIGHIEELKEFARVWPPHVNQIELHPWNQQKEIVDYYERNGIVIEAYCPLVRNRKAADETLVRVAEKHQTTPNQVLVRYALERGWAPLPKSDNPDRIKANADVFGFALDQDDMTMLNGLDQGAAGAIVQAVQN